MNRISQAQMLGISERVEDELSRLFPTMHPSGTRRVFPFDVNGGIAFPRAGIAEFEMTPCPYTRVKFQQLLGSVRDIARAVGTADVRLYQNTSGKIMLEVQVNRPEPVLWGDMMRLAAGLAKYKVPLGIDRSGNLVSIDFSDPSYAHCLISGSTGSGKTALAHGMLMAAAERHTREELRIIVIDPNNESPWLFDAISNHTTKRVNTFADAAKALAGLVQAMYQGKTRGVRVIVFIDELASILADQVNGKMAQRAVEALTQEGRKYNINLIAVTQKPAAAVLGPVMKSNMRRIVGKVSSPEDAKVAAGLAQTGAETLPGLGTFLFIKDDIVRFTGALPPGFGIQAYDEPAGTDFEYDTPQEKERLTLSPGLTLESVVSAMKSIDASGQDVNKTTVLKHMGLKNAGGFNRRINQLWNSAMDEYQNSDTSDTESDVI